MDLIWQAAIISIGINLVMFLPAFIYKTDKLTDLSYAITFIVVATFGFIKSDGNLAENLLLLMITMWAARLGSFLFMRIRHMKKDKRFDQMRDNFLRFGSFWLLQGVSVFVVLIPTTLVFSGQENNLNVFSIVGIVVWATGLLIEAVADNQKFEFSRVKTNKDKWIDRGLWKYSRHPNYFGEISVWVGVFIYCATFLSGKDILIGLIGPIYIAGLILFVSGVPKLEKSADERWGKLAEYKKYKSTTNILIPLPKIGINH